MLNMGLIIVVSLAAGMAMPLGAFIAKTEKISSIWWALEFRHTVMAFGGGALLAAVTLVLVPRALVGITAGTAAFWLILGGLAFMGIDVFLRKIDTPAGQLIAMLADFFPESLALGASFASGDSQAYLLAFLIALQNLPEGYNAYAELAASTQFKSKRVLLMFFAMAFLGPIAGVSGYIWLSNSEYLMSSIMLLASGGILYSIFQDIAPQVKLERHWFPPIGAVLGFMLGMVGMVLSHP